MAERINADTNDGKAWDEFLTTRKALEDSLAPLEDLKGLGLKACNSLEKAANSCNAAYWTEFADTLSSNKAISFISALDTQSAKSDVETAFHAANAFQDALSEQRSHHSDPLSLSMIDAVLDFTIEPIIDQKCATNPVLQGGEG